MSRTTFYFYVNLKLFSQTRALRSPSEHNIFSEALYWQLALPEYKKGYLFLLPTVTRRGEEHSETNQTKQAHKRVPVQ
jgi:hypothetical protein